MLTTVFRHYCIHSISLRKNINTNMSLSIYLTIYSKGYLFWKMWATKARFRFGKPSTMSFGVRYLLQPIRSACSSTNLALWTRSFTDIADSLALHSGAKTFNRQAYASLSCIFQVAKVKNRTSRWTMLETRKNGIRICKHI